VQPILLSAWLALQSVRPAAPGEPALTTTGAFFALSVEDAQASAAWYADKLGLRRVSEQPRTPEVRASVIVMEGGGLIVELVQADEAQPRSAAARAASESLPLLGMLKAGAIVADLDRTLATLRERGVSIAFGPFPARAGQRANFIVRDNAGNLIQFFGP
jgi:catechol 2,3-dioxygenase-like lactoylglutathione lyase family enzyme